jgi:hypothetical protein
VGQISPGTPADLTKVGPVAYILGAGIDKPIGMPHANELLGEVASFADGDGKPIARGLRQHLPHLRFSFEKYTWEQGESFGERVLEQDPTSLQRAKEILECT